MSWKSLPLPSVLLLLLAGFTPAAPPLPLDLIPQDACIGLSIRNLADLVARTDKMLGRPPGDGDVAADASKELKLAWKFDGKRPLALVCLGGKLAGFSGGPDLGGKFSLGASLPFADRNAVLKAWHLKADDLKKVEPIPLPGATIHLPGLFGSGQDVLLNRGVVRADRVFLNSETDAATTAWLKAKTLRAGMPAARQKRLDTADGLFYIGPPLWRFARQFGVGGWAPPEYSEKEADAYRRTQLMWLEVESLLAAVRVEGGLGVDIMTGFDPKGKESQALLKAFNAAGRISNLTGLPAGNPIGAISLVGMDETSLNMARMLAAQIWFGPYGSGPFLASDGVHVRRIVGSLYARLKLGRAALYPTREKARGQLALVAILEPKNAEAFLTDIGAMARVVDDKEFDPKTNTGKAEIEKLVADLGNDDFDVREAASTRLGLIGAPALAALAKAEKSTDAEVRQRAGELRQQIEQVAALRKKELAGGLLKQAFHPSFGWKASAEERAGAKVAFLTMRFDAVDAPYAGWLKDLFGPDWSRLRIAEVNGKVVALFGSDVALFEQTIQNVRANKPGLEASAALANFHKNAGPDRRAEVHLALQRIQALMVPADQLPKDFKPTDEISSFGLRTAPAELGLDFWVPPSSVGTLEPWFHL